MRDFSRGAFLPVYMEGDPEVSMGSPVSQLLGGSIWMEQCPGPWKRYRVCGGQVFEGGFGVYWLKWPSDSTNSAQGLWVLGLCYREHTQRALQEATFPFSEGSQERSKDPSAII